jgi:hypothetical protein
MREANVTTTDSTPAVASVVDDSPEAIAHLRTRITNLTRVIEHADSWRQIAVFRAVQAGLAPDEVAGWASMDAEQVNAIVAALCTDPDMAWLPEGPDFIEFHPRGQADGGVRP